MKLGWYKNSFRRNLVDMHIEDWNDEFLSKLSPEDYCENLKTAKIQSAMVYFQNHNGHCYFPTKVGHIHKAFLKGENKIKRLTELCHENGIDVVGYYSIVYNTYEEEKHPDWRIRNAEGKSLHQMGGRYGHLCPNNPEYLEFTKAQIKEMLEYFDVDGMFYDMPFWPQYCACPYCQARWERETGRKTMPTERDYTNPDLLLHMKRRAVWMGDFCKAVSDYTKELQPGITVEFNYAMVVAGDAYCACSELVNDACDYSGGDLYGSLYNHSFAAKYYRSVTKNQPYEYMTCRCDMNLQQHTVTKSEAHLETEVMFNVANHAATLIIDAIDPRGTMDKRVYERIGKIFTKEQAYEPYMSGKPITDAAILYFTEGRYSSLGQGLDHKSASVNASTTMIQNNILFDVISGCRGDMSKYKLVISPAIAAVPDERVEDIYKYVENGGCFYFSGAEEPKLIKRLLDAEQVGVNDYTRAYVAPKKCAHKIFGEFNADFPLPINHRMPIVKTANASDVFAYITYPYTNPSERRFASIHSNPPGIATRIPAMIVRKIGKGTVVWSAAEIETDERLGFRAVFARLIDFLLPRAERSLKSNAPRQVELVVYDRDGKLQINAVDTLSSDERLALPAFRVSVKCEKQPTALRSITKGKEIPFTWRDGVLSFTVRSLVSFEMIEAE